MNLAENLNIVSFNVLSRQYSPLQMLLKSTGLTKVQVKTTIKKEMKRFNEIIGPELISYFKLILPNSIIFLQEVNNDFLNLIKQNFNSKQIFHTIESDYTIQTIKNKVHKNFNDDHRVILIPDLFIESQITIKEIQILTGFASKSALMVSINIDDMNLVLINLHLHWKMNYNEITNFAEKINGELRKSFVDLEKTRIVISGDFNKGIKKVENFFVKPLNLFGLEFSNNYNLNESGFTSHTTDPNETLPYDIIDHILTFNLKPNGFTQIQTEINGNKIFYNIGQIISTDILNPYENISDHNLIRLKIQI